MTPPLPSGAGLNGLPVVWDEACHRPDAVVVSLGPDAADPDPESPLRVTAAGYHEAGRRLRRLAPLVLIQEGGYDLTTLGEFAVTTLRGATG
jgi:acetoin utilization deacetylase AcuC-like enzyme